jgi:hypothetical protein
MDVVTEELVMRREQGKKKTKGKTEEGQYVFGRNHVRSPQRRLPNQKKIIHYLQQSTFSRVLGGHAPLSNFFLRSFTTAAVQTHPHDR